MAAPQYPGKLSAPRRFRSIKRERKRPASIKEFTSNEGEKQDVASEVAPEITNSFEVRQEITSFSNDDSGIIQPTPGERIAPKLASMQFTDARNHDVISYLQRPQLVRQFQYPCAAARNTIISGAPIMVPDILFTSLVSGKLDGFTSFRATAVFKLQVNAQPFQAGRLLLYSVPMPTLVGPRVDWIQKHITMAQALHNVQMDIDQQTEIELRVPFISPFNSYDLINGKYPWAQIFVMVYSQLNQVGGDALECLLWAHFEDIELGAPTSGKMKVPIQQSGRVRPNKGAPKEPSNSMAMMARASEATGTLPAVSAGAESGWSKIGNTLPFLKPVTDIFGGLAGAAGSFLKPLGGLLPGLGSIFGLSKPQISHSGNSVVIRPMQYYTNVDGIDHSHVLSLNALNCIDEYPNLGGTDLSETSLSFLKTIPQFVGAFNYGLSNKYNDSLFSIFVTPTTFVPADVSFKPTDTAVPTFKVKQPTVLNYISSPFLYWTGSLVYTFRFVKTHYHSGRVEISFHPFVANVDTTRMEYVYRLVIDLRDNSEISVSIPYISPTPWKRLDTTLDAIPSGQQTWGQVGSTIVGVVFVRALTPLYVGNNIASNVVECVVEVRAGEDYEVQAPVKSPYFPIRFGNRVSQIARQQGGDVYAFPGTFETRTTAIEGKMPTSITGMQTDVMQPSTSMFCAGEKFEDFRALTRRFAFTQRLFQYLDSSDPRAYYYFIEPLIEYIRPPELNTLASGAELNFKLFTIPTPLVFVASMYAFFRGSLRVKVVSDSSYFSLSAVRLEDRNAYDRRSTTSTPFNYIAPTAYESINLKLFGEFQIPYYSPTIITVPYPDETNENIITQPLTNIVYGFDKDMGINAETPELLTLGYVATAAADDMSYHMFLGVPPILNEATLLSSYKMGNKDISYFQLSEMSCDPCFITQTAASNLTVPTQQDPLITVKDVIFSDYSNMNPPKCPQSVFGRLGNM